MLNLKEMHMRQQSELVKEIRSMAVDSKGVRNAMSPGRKRWRYIRGRSQSGRRRT